MPNLSSYLGTTTLILMLTLFITYSAGETIVKHDQSHVRDNSKGWFRVCNNHPNSDPVPTFNHYEVEAETCPHGAWLSERLHAGCVCLNGLWAISQSWCDEDYLVAYGRGDCFQLDKAIQKLTFLGNTVDPFGPTNFVTKENGHVFRSFIKEFTMPYEFSRDTNRTILRLRPDRGTGVLLEIKEDIPWEEEYMRMNLLEEERALFEEEPICFDTSFKNDWNKDALMIYKVNTRIKYMKVTEQCPKTSHFDYGLGLDDSHKKDNMAVFKVLPGQAIHVKSGTLLKATTNCLFACSLNNVSSNFKQSNAHTNKLIRHKRQALEPLVLDMEFTSEERDELVRTSNLRVVKQELNWLLEGIRPPTLKTGNWKLAQKIKQVFVKACPSAEAPTFLVNAMMRLFRLFYLNSRDFFPNGHMLEEKAQNERMINTLDLCLNDASEFTFTYDLIKDDTKPCRQDKNEDNPNKTTTYCKCKELLGYVNMSYALNLTGPVESHLVYGEALELTENLIFLIPQENQFDSTVHDFPTETIWKVIMFAHFYCAKYFTHNPGDFSALMTKMEDFFNEDIIYRWTKPGAHSFKVWQYLYSAFDLKKFAKSVDACVAVAKFVSAYPEWLNRPTLDIKRRRKRSLDSAKLWKGSAYCLDDPWDPVYKLGVEIEDKCVDLNRY